MTVLTKESILAAQDRQVRELHIPQWGGMVRLKSLTAAEWEPFAQLCRDRTAQGAGFDIRHIRAKLLQLSMIDAAGVLMFQPEDIPLLEQKSTAIVELLWNECRELNALSDEAVEELQGN
jgi:hypothetical protein